jgi:hypothetical protein
MGLRSEDAASQPPSAEEVATSERFFRHGLLPIAFYQPGLSALQCTPHPLLARFHSGDSLTAGSRGDTVNENAGEAG